MLPYVDCDGEEPEAHFTAEDVLDMRGEDSSNVKSASRETVLDRTAAKTR